MICEPLFLSSVKPLRPIRTHTHTEKHVPIWGAHCRPGRERHTSIFFFPPQSRGTPNPSYESHESKLGIENQLFVFLCLERLYRYTVRKTSHEPYLPVGHVQPEAVQQNFEDSFLRSPMPRDKPPRVNSLRFPREPGDAGPW